MELFTAIADALIRSNLSPVFGVMGEANLGVIAKYVERAGRYVPAAHEAGAVAMADGFSRLSGQVGVATVTEGPGVTKALTALTEAVRAGSSVLVLTGSRPGGEHRQSIDLQSAVRLAGAAYREVHDEHLGVSDLMSSVRLCEATGQPLVLNIPVAMMTREVGSQVSRFEEAHWTPQPAPAASEVLDRALGVIAASDRPAILVGRGATAAAAGQEILALAELLDAPVATTVMAMNFLEGYPLHLGIAGSESHSVAIKCISEADCLIVLGASLNDHTTAGGNLTRGKVIVRCDRNPEALAWQRLPGVAVVADAVTFASQIREALSGLGGMRRPRWSDRVRRELEALEVQKEFSDRSTRTGLDLRAAMVTLDTVLPTKRVVVTDIGRFKTAVWRFLGSGGRFTQSGSFGAIGLGLPMGIGASFACPDSLTVAVVGDGGLMMSMAELATAASEKLPFLVIVANDGCYAAERWKLSELGLDPGPSALNSPPLAQLARAFGLDAISVGTVAEIAAAGPWLKRSSATRLLDLRLDPAIDSRRRN